MKDGYVATMQPYIFPYIGYFHLIECSSIFVFYDDVHYIKKGWINRNRILINNKPFLFTIPVAKVSQNKLIYETSPVFGSKWKNKFYRQLAYNYKGAPFFYDIIELVSSVFEKKYTDVSDLSIESILAVYRYLGISFEYTKSSLISSDTRGIGKADRLIGITKELGYGAYVNAPGGKKLYAKDYFSTQGVTLAYVNSKQIKYKQNSDKFVPSLSIIDILMFNDKERILEFFSAFSVE